MRWLFTLKAISLSQISSRLSNFSLTISNLGSSIWSQSCSTSFLRWCLRISRSCVLSALRRFSSFPLNYAESVLLSLSPLRKLRSFNLRIFSTLASSFLPHLLSPPRNHTRHWQVSWYFYSICPILSLFWAAFWLLSWTCVYSVGLLPYHRPSINRNGCHYNTWSRFMAILCSGFPILFSLLTCRVRSSERGFFQSFCYSILCRRSRLGCQLLRHISGFRR